MATTGAVGGSQIDVRGLANQLVAADRKMQDQRVTRDTTRVTTQISALGQLMGSMSSFRSTLASLKSVDVFSARTAVSADKTMFTATAASKAVPGSYDIEVVQLAKAQQISSNPFAGGSATVVGTGTLTLSLGSASFSVDIGTGAATLANIRDAINAASDNVGVRATLVQGTDGSRLVLSSAKTGAVNTITVAQTGGDGGLAQIAYSQAQPGGYTVIKPAHDAIVNIAGAQSTSQSNVIDDAIDGVTLTLLKQTTAGEPVSLEVGYDSSAVTKRIESFVTAYNALASQIGKLRSYSPATKVAGPMLGDSLLAGIESELRRTLSSAVPGQAGGYETLASIGITTKLDGTLGIDSTKLQKALGENFDAVGKLFGSENGVAARLSKQLEAQLETGGGIDTRNKKLVEQQKGIAKLKEDIDARMEVRLQTYIRQFTKLDTLLSQLQVTSSYMSQQIESLQNMNKS